MKYLIILLFVFFLACSQYDRESELRVVDSFPDPTSNEPENFLAHPFGLEIYHGNILVLDAVEGCIKEYTSSGEFIRQIGKKGKGPGELLDPFIFTISETRRKIFVVNQATNGISIFDYENGKFLYEIKSFNSLVDVITIGGNIYSYSPNLGNKKTVNLYDSTGILKKSFGEYFDERVNQTKFKEWMYHFANLETNKDSIYIIFKNLPYVNIYDKYGTFIRNINIRVDEIQNRYEENITAKDRGSIIDWNRGTCIESNYLYAYVGIREKKHRILKIDLSGKLIQEIPIKIEDVDEQLLLFRKKTKENFIFINLATSQVVIFKEFKM